MINADQELIHESYLLQYRKCGKAACSTYRNSKGHGPYWYAYRWIGSGSKRRMKSRYVGKKHPALVLLEQAQSKVK